MTSAGIRPSRSGKRGRPDAGWGGRLRHCATYGFTIFDRSTTLSAILTSCRKRSPNAGPHLEAQGPCHRRTPRSDRPARAHTNPAGQSRQRPMLLAVFVHAPCQPYGFRNTAPRGHTKSRTRGPSRVLSCTNAQRDAACRPFDRSQDVGPIDLDAPPREPCRVREGRSEMMTTDDDDERDEFPAHDREIVDVISQGVLARSLVDGSRCCEVRISRAIRTLGPRAAVSVSRGTSSARSASPRLVFQTGNGQCAPYAFISWCRRRQRASQIHGCRYRACGSWRRA
ncbi:hypothetical protein PMI06_008763 [Burkholderia sp. BT03]|nr:hypothetical protein PMI06_008763 [Burkholderia sp. BT03]SKC52415.1 hypothetical protein SAMN06266956_0506 [Paraburkholderia hospita]